MGPKRMSVSINRRTLLGSFVTLAVVSTWGCSGPDNPTIIAAPAPRPASAAEKAEPEGKPKNYGAGSVYQKSMERAAKR